MVPRFLRGSRKGQEDVAEPISGAQGDRDRNSGLGTLMNSVAYPCLPTILGAVLRFRHELGLERERHAWLGAKRRCDKGPLWPGTSATPGVEEHWWVWHPYSPVNYSLNTKGATPECSESLAPDARHCRAVMEAGSGSLAMTVPLRLSAPRVTAAGRSCVFSASVLSSGH